MKFNDLINENFDLKMFSVGDKILYNHPSIGKVKGIVTKVILNYNNKFIVTMQIKLDKPNAYGITITYADNKDLKYIKKIDGMSKKDSEIEKFKNQIKSLTGYK
jgi:hypothetical protein